MDKENAATCEGQQPNEENQTTNLENDSQRGNDPNLPRDFRFVHNHPSDLILGDPSQGVKTRNSLRNLVRNLAFLSQMEPKNIKEAECDSS